jgi:hypothetical protein
MQDSIGEPFKKPLLVRPQLNGRLIKIVHLRKIFVRIGD